MYQSKTQKRQCTKKLKSLNFYTQEAQLSSVVSGSVSRRAQSIRVHADRIRKTKGSEIQGGEIHENNPLFLIVFCGHPPVKGDGVEKRPLLPLYFHVVLGAARRVREDQRRLELPVRFPSPGSTKQRNLYRYQTFFF